MDQNGLQTYWSFLWFSVLTIVSRVKGLSLTGLNQIHQPLHPFNLSSPPRSRRKHGRPQVMERYLVTTWEMRTTNLNLVLWKACSPCSDSEHQKGTKHSTGSTSFWPRSKESSHCSLNQNQPIQRGIWVEYHRFLSIIATSYPQPGRRLIYPCVIRHCLAVWQAQVA